MRILDGIYIGIDYASPCRQLHLRGTISMPKPTRMRAPTSAESESSSENEDEREAAPLSRRDGPPRRRSLPGEYPQDLDDDRSRRAGAGRGGRFQHAPRQSGTAGRTEQSPTRRGTAKGKKATSNVEDQLETGETTRRTESRPVDLDAVGPDPSVEDMDEQTRQAIAASLMEPQVPASYEGDFDEEELRKVMEESMLGASTQQEPSFLPDDEEDLQQLIESSRREYEAQQRGKDRREAELARRQEEDLLEAIKLSQREAQQSGHQAEEEAMAKAKRLNEAVNAEGVRRRVERMAFERYTSTPSDSNIEASPTSGQRGSLEIPSASAPATPSPMGVTAEPAGEPLKPKRSLLESITRRSSSTSRSLSVKGKPRSKISTLAAIPENAVASSSSPSPSRT
ncbi:MAG: hypothetical protein LQ346_006053, partial [Caloplaca aetnensis]